MELKAQWILSEQEIMAFQKQKPDMYSQYQYESLNEQLLTKNHIKKFVYFMRSRRSQIDYPLKFEKVIYYAVSLYKRYYLVNSYIKEEPIQSLICAVYASLKFNEYEENFLIKMAGKWKEKSVFAPAKRLPHFGDEGYTAEQLKFLSGIGYQTAMSKLIQPLQAIFDEIAKRTPRKQEWPQISQTRAYDHHRLLPSIFEALEKLYCHPTLIFLYEGSKLALVVAVMALRRCQKPQSVMGEELQIIVQQNMEEIESIIQVLEMGIQNPTERDVTKLSKILKYKKPQPRKSSQSPRFLPKHDTLTD